MIVTLTIDELTRIVRNAIAAANVAPAAPSLLLNTTEAAKLLNIPATWLGSMAREGKIKSVKLGHYVRFKRDDLEVFIRQMKDQGQES
jgi:excisionase family DNA binding protein